MMFLFAAKDSNQKNTAVSNIRIASGTRMH